jgi:hypothetical protein
MSGMGAVLQLTNPTVVAAFRAALIHQAIVALLIFFLIALLWVSVREWVPSSATGGAAAPPVTPAEPPARERSLAASPAARACGLAGLTAAAFSPAGAPLPAGAARGPAAAVTLAAGPGGGFEALVAHGRQLSVGQATGAGWAQVQLIKVAIPYGSSG